VLAWLKARASIPCGSDSSAEGRGEGDPAAAAAAATAECEARLEQVRCDLEVERLQTGKTERERREQERLERMQEVRAWRAEEAQRRIDRRARREAFWENRRKGQEALGGVTGTLTVLLALGIPTTLALLIYALAASAGEGEPSVDKWEVLAIGLLTAASAFAVGALLGFLFGIPRSIAAPASTTSKDGTENKDGAEEPEAVQHFAANTNLEQISDWLTKILVGVGLVQIHEVGGAIEDLADGLAPGLGPQGFSVAVALLVAFSITGFVSAYLFTRLRLQGAFELASAIKRAVKQRANTETTAIGLVQKQLAPGVEEVPLDALIKALKAATPGAKLQAFFLARRQRAEALSNAGVEGNERKELVESAISIFQALLSCESQKDYYFRLRAELGYARLQLCDWVRARAEFDEAIKLRPQDWASRTPEYELNRAYANIKLAGEGKASSDETAAAIYGELDAVVNRLDFKEVDEAKRRAITTWLRVNATASDELAPKLKGLLKRLEEKEGS